MNDLTDLEICEKIAEIVGCPYDDGLVQAYGNWINPLLDTMRAKAFCFDFMVEYHVVIKWIGLNQEALKPKCQACSEANSLACISDESINRAVCLAIIEANSDDE